MTVVHWVDCISVFLCTGHKVWIFIIFYHYRVVLESLAVSMATAHNCSSFVFVVRDSGLVWGDVLQQRACAVDICTDDWWSQCRILLFLCRGMSDKPVNWNFVHVWFNLISITWGTTVYIDYRTGDQKSKKNFFLSLWCARHFKVSFRMQIWERSKYILHLLVFNIKLQNIIISQIYFNTFGGGLNLGGRCYNQVHFF